MIKCEEAWSNGTSDFEENASGPEEVKPWDVPKCHAVEACEAQLSG